MQSTPSVRQNNRSAITDKVCSVPSVIEAGYVQHSGDYSKRYRNVKNEDLWPTSTSCRCWYCAYEITDSPIGIPQNVNANGKYLLDGFFCSFECALGDLNRRQTHRETSIRRVRLYDMAREEYNIDITLLHAAPPRELLDHFGGPLSRDEFRLRSSMSETGAKLRNEGHNLYQCQVVSDSYEERDSAIIDAGGADSSSLKQPETKGNWSVRGLRRVETTECNNESTSVSHDDDGEVGDEMEYIRDAVQDQDQDRDQDPDQYPDQDSEQDQSEIDEMENIDGVHKTPMDEQTDTMDVIRDDLAKSSFDASPTHETCQKKRPRRTKGNYS